MLTKLIGRNISELDWSDELFDLLIDQGVEPLITPDGTIYDVISADGYGLDGSSRYNYEFVRFRDGQIEEHGECADFNHS